MLTLALVFHRGDVLRKWREGKGWSKEQLAERADVDKNTVARIEKSGHGNTSTLDKLAHALGHSLAQIDAAISGSGLTEEDQQLLTLWNRIPSREDRRAILAVLRRFDASAR